MPAERTEYKGRPMITLKRDDDDKYPFSFGVVKAKLLLANLDAVENFIKEVDAEDAKKNDG